MRLHANLGELLMWEKSKPVSKKRIFSEAEKWLMRKFFRIYFEIMFIFWRVFGDFQWRKGAFWKSWATVYVWGSYGNCWIHLAKYLVHAWLNFVSKPQKFNPLVSPTLNKSQIKMMRLSNNNVPFSDNWIISTKKTKVYVLIYSAPNLHKKVTENKHNVGINLGEPI